LDSLVFCVGKLDLVWFLDLEVFLLEIGFGFRNWRFFLGNWIWFGFSGYVALSINNTKIPCSRTLHKSKTTLLSVFSFYRKFR
jgi:hypothetical protein